MSEQGNRIKEWFSACGTYLHTKLQGLKDKIRQANNQEFDFESIKNWFAETTERFREKLQELKSQENKLTWADVRTWFHLHGRQLAIYLLMPSIGIVLALVIQDQTRKQADIMYLRQAQLTAVQSMIQKSKLTSLSGDPSPPLNDNEVETIRIMLQNRGITPSILRLNLNRGGSMVELQAEQVPFGQWIAFLDEAAQRWDLFPVDLNVVAGDAPEIVAIRGVLQQTSQGN